MDFNVIQNKVAEALRSHKKYKSGYNDFIFANPSVLADPKTFTKYLPGTQQVAQELQNYLMANVPEYAEYMRTTYPTITPSSPSIPVSIPTSPISQPNEMEEIKKGIYGTNESLEKTIENYNNVIGKQMENQEWQQNAFRLLITSMLKEMYQPKMTGNPFLDMITSYTAARQRTNPDYEFKGLLGNFLAKKSHKTSTPEEEYLEKQGDWYNQTYRSFC